MRYVCIYGCSMLYQLKWKSGGEWSTRRKELLTPFFHKKHKERTSLVRKNGFINVRVILSQLAKIRISIVQIVGKDFMYLVQLV